jgi:hypothetical protein
MQFIVIYLANNLLYRMVVVGLDNVSLFGEADDE